VAAPPLDSPRDRPVTYAGDSKTLVKSSKGRSGQSVSKTTRGRDGGTNFNFRIKEQDNKPNFHEHDDDDDDLYRLMKRFYHFRAFFNSAIMSAM
jgi:hypothetical protein